MIRRFCLLKFLHILLHVPIFFILLQDVIVLLGLVFYWSVIVHRLQWLFQPKVNEVLKAGGQLAERVSERTEIGTVVFLGLKDGGKKEILGGSMVFIHNNYKI